MNPSTSQDALSQLQQIQSQSQDPNTILSGQRQQLGVNAANDTVTGLRGAINNTTKLLKQVAPSVMGRTGNSLVTAAQSGRIIQNEQAPISQTLTDQGTQYGQAEDDANKLEQEAEQAATGTYQGQQDKLSYAQNLYNTLYQKEKDAQAAAQAEADRQEQIRQFNATLASTNAKNAAAGGSSFDLGGSTPLTSTAAKSATPATGSTQQQAYNALKDLLATKNKNTITATIQAIQKSANNGNAYDKMKLDLIANGLGTQFQPYIIGNNSSLRF